MATFELPETPQPRVSPALAIGLGSPLWGYFGAAAATGVAYWWMTRWTRPVSLEALFEATVASPAAEPVVAAVEMAADAAPIVGDEAVRLDPISVVGESQLPAAPEPRLESTLPVASLPAAEADLAPKARARRATPEGDA